MKEIQDHKDPKELQDHEEPKEIHMYKTQGHIGNKRDRIYTGFPGPTGPQVGLGGIG